MDKLVECHSGYEYGERPTALEWQGKRLEIVQVTDRWRIPSGRCFRVRTMDEQIFELCYSELNHEWHIQQS